MASKLPPVPRFVFTVLEPVSLIAGYVPAVFMPVWFIGQQIALTEPIRVSDNDQLVAQQLGNCYGLACLVALAVLYTSTEIQVVRNYLKALWIADIGHLVLTFYALGYDRSISIHTWNAMTWGNIGATAFLFLTRTAYFLGLFGPDAPPTSSPKKLE